MRYPSLVLIAASLIAASLIVGACSPRPSATATDDGAPVDQAPLTVDGGGLPGSPVFDPLEVLRRADAVGGLTSLSVPDATAIIDGYISALGQRAGSEAIVGELQDLRGALTANTIDGAEVGRLLSSLGARTETAAQGESSYEVLGRALRSAGEGLR